MSLNNSTLYINTMKTLFKYFVLLTIMVAFIILNIIISDGTVFSINFISHRKFFGYKTDYIHSSKYQKIPTLKYAQYKYYDWYFEEHNETVSKPSSPNANKTILLWHAGTRYINRTDGLEPLPDCNEPDCYATTNRTFMPEAQVVIFNAEYTKDPNPPTRSNRDQLWVFQNQEPPLPYMHGGTTYRKPQWHNVFNYTMWFRTDATLFAPFGIIVEKTKVEERNWTEVMEHKQNKIAWMVTRCSSQSQREKYVDKLKNYVPIDVFGGCSKTKVPRGNVKEFGKLLNKQYKFYLSFENSFAQDYISEKFFLYYNLDVIVIARGAGNYSEHAPNNTYINTQDFKSIESLGKHLQYLINNSDAYLDILKEKNKYHSLIIPYITARGNTVLYIHHQFERAAMCELCRRGKEPSKYRNIVNRIDQWFDKKPLISQNDIH